MRIAIIRSAAVAVAALLFQPGFPADFSSYASAQSQTKIDSVKRPNKGAAAPARAKSATKTKPGKSEAAGGSDDRKMAEPERSLLTEVRLLSTATYTRVALELSREAKYRVHRLKEDPAKGLPPRIFIDIAGARLAMRSQDPITVEDNLLRQVRVGQFSQDIVRVVLDVGASAQYNSFFLKDPVRLVIDVKGPAGAKAAKTQSTKKAVAAVKEKRPAPPPTLRKIVLDPGHGGKDPGAIGAGGIAEKDVVLSIARKLAVKLRKQLGIEVVLTRTDDSYVALEDRTAVANAEDADLFISLHMNASPNPGARGLETYYLDNTTDEASIRLAARENSTSRRNVSDLQFILSDMTQNMKLEDSISLAHRVQSSLVSTMSRKMPDVKDLGVKKALFYVLVGARMPSVLVEMFFITNKIEGAAMSQENYQDAMADALLEGIRQYNLSTMAVKTL